MSRVLFGPEQLQERGHDAFRLAGVPAAVGDDRVLHRWRVQHLHGAQRLARKLASYSRARKKCDAKVALDHLFGRLDGVELHQAAEAHSGRKKRSLRDLVVAGRAVEHDQLLRGHLGHRDVGELGQRMIWSADEIKVSGVEGAQLEVWVLNATTKADLYFVAQAQLEQVFRMTCAHGHLDSRVCGHEPLQQVREHVGADRRRGRDHQVARGGGHHLLQRVPAVDKGAQRALGERDPGAAGVGQAHAVWRAQEQGRAELALEALKACGQRRLGDEEGLGGPADAAPPGDLEEALDLDELDATWLPVTGFFYGHGRTLQILSIGRPARTVRTECQAWLVRRVGSQSGCRPTSEWLGVELPPTRHELDRPAWLHRSVYSSTHSCPPTSPHPPLKRDKDMGTPGTDSHKQSHT